MFHYFEAITNTSGDSLIGYFARVVDPATQNTVTISADDNGTPIVTTSGVENAAVTDAYGNLDFYVVPGTYHLDIYAPNATSLILRVQNVSMNSTKGDPGDKGEVGDVGASDATFSTLAALKAINPATYPSPRLAALSGSDGGVANGLFTYQNGNFTGRTDVVVLNSVPVTTGALVRQGAQSIVTQLPDTGAVSQTVQASLSAMLFVSKFGVLPGGADGTAAMNRAVLAVATRGGGTLVFDAASSAYQINGPVFLPSNVHIDLNGQTLNGSSGDMFQSGFFNGTTLVSNVADGPEVNIVQNASLRNGNITNANRCWNLKNFNQECVIADIQTRDCAAVGLYKRCFSMTLSNVSARGGSSVTIPTHYFQDQSNSIILDRVKSVTEWPVRFTGGANVVDITGCECEGGTKGFVFEGDNLDITIRKSYFEAISGAALDVSTAGSCGFFIQGCYFNQVGDAFKHGTASTATLKGMWTPDNELVNTVGGAFPIMRLLGPRNYIDWQDKAVDDPTLAVPSNWLIDKATRYRRDQRWNADALSDVRAVSTHNGDGIIARHYGGDSGNPFTGTIPFSSYTLPTGASVTAAITTNIVLQAVSSITAFVISFNDNAGTKRVSGLIMGTYVWQPEGTDRPVTVSSVSGKLVLSVGSINNTNGAVTLTGTVRLV